MANASIRVYPEDAFNLEFELRTSTYSMDSASSPCFPFTSDTALRNDWEENIDTTIIPSSTNSDDFEAIYLVQQETIARKNKAGEVIQHRAWPLGETFRSEADYFEGGIFNSCSRSAADCFQKPLCVRDH